MESKYYDWNKTISYDADVTVVISMRGFGKTYGLRKQCISDYINNGYRFVQIVRFKNSIPNIAADYFGKVSKEKKFKDYMFKTHGSFGYIAKRPKDKNDKPQWKLLCYFVALSQMQQTKEQTFTDVKRLIFDEAILDFRDRFHNYLPNEYSLLANVVDSCTRENAEDETAIKPRLYCLANACDLINPIFMRYGVTREPEYGYSWHDGKNMLLHYVAPEYHGELKLNETVAGRMTRGTSEADITVNNRFLNANTDFVEKKTANAKFQYAIKYDADIYAVWVDWNAGLYFISSKIPNNTNKPIISLTARDNRINYVLVKRSNKLMQNLLELYYLGLIRYESIAQREKFIKMLSLFGVRQ